MNWCATRTRYFDDFNFNDDRNAASMLDDVMTRIKAGGASPALHSD